MKTGRVFLCHNSREKETIKALALRLLSEGGIRTWLDTWEVPGGADWEKHIRREFAASWSCLIFLGPSSLGPFQRIEIEWAKERQAIDPDYRLIPIVLPGVEQAGVLELEMLLPGVQRVVLVEDLTAIFSALRGDGPGPPVQALTVAVAAERWDQTGRRDRSLLIRGRVLNEAQRVALTVGTFDDLSLSFLASSAEAAQNRLRWSVAVLAAATALFGAGAWYANNRRQAAEVAEIKATASENDAIAQRDIARKQTKLAENRLNLATSQAKAADARREAPQELHSALVDSVDAYKINPSLEAKTALIESLTRAAKIERYYLCPPGEKGTGVTFSPDGATFAFTCGFRETTIFIVDAGGKLLRSARVSGDGRSIAFLASETIAIGGSRDLRILDSNQTRLQTFNGHRATISTVASAPRRQLIFTSDSTGEVRVWRRAGPMQVWSSQVLRHSTSRISTNLTWREGSGLRIDDVGSSGKPYEVFSIDGQGSPSAFPISPGEERFAASPFCAAKFPAAIRSITNGTGGSGRVFAYNTESNEIIVDDQRSCVPLFGHTHNFVLAFRPDGNSLVSVGAVANGDGIHGAILWDLNQIHPLAQLLRASKRRYARDAELALSHDGSSWACVNCDDTVVWDGREVILPDPPDGPSSGRTARSIALSPDGSELAIATQDGTMTIATRTGTRFDLKPIQPAPGSIRRIWFAGWNLYAISAEGAVARRAGDKWLTIRETPALRDASCSDLFNAGPYFAFERRTDPRTDVITFRNLEMTSAAPLAVRIPSDAGICSSLAYAGASQVGVRLTVEHKAMFFFSISSRVDLNVWENPIHAQSGLQTSLTSARISDDGKLLLAISSGDEASLVILDLGSRKLIGNVPVPGLSGVALSGDGKRAITFSEAGLLRWSLDPADWAEKASELAGSSN
jgi:WD40 repeat protein